MSDTIISIPDNKSVNEKNDNKYFDFSNIPLYVLIFMLFMASSYFTNFFPQHTAKLISNEPIARHILGYTILITSVASVNSEERIIKIIITSFFGYTWCYLISRQGPISFSLSIMLLLIAYLLNRDLEHYKENNKKIINIFRYICIFINIAIIIFSLFYEY